MDQFIKLIWTLSIPQLDNLRDEMLRQKQLNFNTDPNFPLKLDAIWKEIRLAKGYELWVPNKQLKHGFFGAPKRLNPYNALWNVAPKNKLGLKQWIPGMVLSELLTYNAAVPLSILYAKTLNKDTVAGFKNAFGIWDKEGKWFAYRSDYERAKDELEWKNAA